MPCLRHFNILVNQVKGLSHFGVQIFNDYILKSRNHIMIQQLDKIEKEITSFE